MSHVYAVFQWFVDDEPVAIDVQRIGTVAADTPTDVSLNIPIRLSQKSGAYMLHVYAGYTELAQARGDGSRPSRVPETVRDAAIPGLTAPRKVHGTMRGYPACLKSAVRVTTRYPACPNPVQKATLASLVCQTAAARPIRTSPVCRHRQKVPETMRTYPVCLTLTTQATRRYPACRRPTLKTIYSSPAWLMPEARMFFTPGEKSAGSRGERPPRRRRCLCLFPRHPGLRTPSRQTMASARLRGGHRTAGRRDGVLHPSRARFARPILSWASDNIVPTRSGASSDFGET